MVQVNKWPQQNEKGKTSEAPKKNCKGFEEIEAIEAKRRVKVDHVCENLELNERGI